MRHICEQDGSGTIDRDEFAALISSMMLTQHLSREESTRALQEDFDAADTGPILIRS